MNGMETTRLVGHGRAPKWNMTRTGMASTAASARSPTRSSYGSVAVARCRDQRGKPSRTDKLVSKAEGIRCQPTNDCLARWGRGDACGGGHYRLSGRVAQFYLSDPRAALSLSRPLCRFTADLTCLTAGVVVRRPPCSNGAALICSKMLMLLFQLGTSGRER